MVDEKDCTLYPVHDCAIEGRNLSSILQVPPDFYLPDFDEDEQNPDERMDRKWNCQAKQITKECNYFLSAHGFAISS